MGYDAATPGRGAKCLVISDLGWTFLKFRLKKSSFKKKIFYD